LASNVIASLRFQEDWTPTPTAQWICDLGGSDAAGSHRKSTSEHAQKPESAMKTSKKSDERFQIVTDVSSAIRVEGEIPSMGLACAKSPALASVRSEFASFYGLSFGASMHATY
jgi:hypothetical protein